MKKLSVCLATYDDYDGVFFTIQSLRLHHLIPLQQSMGLDWEIVVLDNHPNSAEGKATRNFVTGKLGNKGKYIPYPVNPTSFNKYHTLNHCSGELVLLLDCHVLLVPDSLEKLMIYMNSGEYDERDLLQGPLLHDNLVDVETHFEEVWRGHMWGIWASNLKEYNLGKPFEIPMQGMGLCAFSLKNFPEINKGFRGFGGEEGYIAEKFRINGGKNLCLPFLKWNHRFERPNGVKYPLSLEDRVYNYYLGWGEVYGKNSPRLDEITNHFMKEVKCWNKNKFESIRKSATNQ